VKRYPDGVESYGKTSASAREEGLANEDFGYEDCSRAADWTMLLVHVPKIRRFDEMIRALEFYALISNTFSSGTDKRGTGMKLSLSEKRTVKGLQSLGTPGGSSNFH